MAWAGRGGHAAWTGRAAMRRGSGGGIAGPGLDGGAGDWATRCVAEKPVDFRTRGFGAGRSGTEEDGIEVGSKSAPKTREVGVFTSEKGLASRPHT